MGLPQQKLFFFAEILSCNVKNSSWLLVWVISQGLGFFRSTGKRYLLQASLQSCYAIWLHVPWNATAWALIISRFADRHCWQFRLLWYVKITRRYFMLSGLFVFKWISQSEILGAVTNSPACVDDRNKRLLVVW